MIAQVLAEGWEAAAAAVPQDQCAGKCRASHCWGLYLYFDAHLYLNWVLKLLELALADAESLQEMAQVEGYLLGCPLSLGSSWNPAHHP